MTKSVPAVLRRLVTALLATATAVGALVTFESPAEAAGPRVTRVVNVSAQHQVIYVYSPSMRKVIPNDVLRAPGRPTNAPNFYLLNGIDGGEWGFGWMKVTRHRDFFKSKRVNVISPLGGARSLYTDWALPDPVYGVNKWQTYLNRELPQALRKVLGTNPNKAIAGLSMSGGSAIDLAMQSRGAYKAAASYSGCPNVSSPLGAAFVHAEIGVGAGIPPLMWGPYPAPAWFDHDPTVNPRRLGKTKLYFSAAPGVPGAIDKLPGSPGINLAHPLEATAKACTEPTVRALRAAGRNVTYKKFPRGVHSWGVFTAGLYDSWRVVGPAIGA